jgi:antirestriction protein
MTKQELTEIYEEKAKALDIPVDVVEAYAEEMYDEEAKNIEEAYSGRFNSDKDFAQDMAENTGAVNFRIFTWPHYCIDWEWAARDLMLDYTEIDKHYFRNL